MAGGHQLTHPRSDAAEKAYNTVWGEKCPGHKRGHLLSQLADAIDANADEIASIESLGESLCRFSTLSSFSPASLSTQLTRMAL